MRLCVAALVTAMMAVSCGDSEGIESVGDTASSTSALQTAERSEEDGGRSQVGGRSTESAAASDSTYRSTTSTPTTVVSSTAAAVTTQVSFPPSLESLTHGGTVWAVVLAGAELGISPDPAAIEELEQAVAAAAAAGYVTGLSECDFGAAEALGFLDPAPSMATVSVYFHDQATALAALQAFAARGIDGVVRQVETYCMD